MEESVCVSDSKVFSIRIVSIDYYMSPPIPDLDFSYSSFQGGKVNEVPVIRIYGSTPAGQKTCLQIHQALPYLYVPCGDIPIQQDEGGLEYTHVMSRAVEKALKLRGNAGLKRQHVHGCTLVRARKFYGYHSKEELFVKIYLYYPHDVSRAASLLLGGAVLDKTLQPHESHIPYLLQFLVDYNLYGMGHIHLSRMKFRHPVPDVFASRKARDKGFHGHETDKFTHTTPDFQADSSADVHLGSPHWLSSTIPAGWMWPSSVEFDASSDQGSRLIKRQSVCELEGDAIVDDILNQQFKICSSLSQNTADVKMVQSLVPIWEEEHERTGMHDAAVPPDPGKPLPEDVLRTLANGLELESTLMELCAKAERSPSSTPLEKDDRFLQSIKSLTEGNLIELGHTESSHCDGASTAIGSLSSQGPICMKQSLVDEMQTSQLIGTLDPKAADKEALGLLKWLASSQAAEDINSDDELVRETILSPLLPASTVEKVLEKANLDFESESQQECQDILDSIGDLIDFQGFNERPTHSDKNSSLQSSSEGKIPQVDGSGDEQSSIPCPGKKKKNKAMWGSLPLSMSRKVNDDLQFVSCIITDKCKSETIGSIGTSFSAGNKSEKCADVSMSGADSDGSSVRDLMRRKRHFRNEPPECLTREVKRVLLEEEKKENSFLCPKKLVFETLETEKLDLKPFGSHDLRSSIDSQMKEDLHQLSHSGMQESPQSMFDSGHFKCKDSEHLEKTDAATQNTVLHYKSGGGEQGISDGLSVRDGLLSAVVNMEVGPTQLFGMTLCNKPPTMDCTNGKSENALFQLTTPHDPSLANVGKNGGTSVRQRDADVLPFFEEGFEEEQGIRHEFNRNNDHFDISSNHENIMGVPTHYKNDGGLLYMLAPVISPPTADCVHRWLLHNDTELSDNLIVSRARPGSFNEDLADSTLESHIKPPILDELNQVHGNSGKNYPLQNDKTTELQSGGTHAKVKEITEILENISQISGPDLKTKPTPLSQSGFRDPASVGAGQQLTLLSIEVQAESRGDLRPDPRFDAINFIVLAFQEDNGSFFEVYVLLHYDEELCHRNIDGISGCKVLVSSQEQHLIDHFAKIICLIDPDILMGWDIQGTSLGFLAERASHLGIGLLKKISRTPCKSEIAGFESEIPEKGTPDNVPPQPLLADSVVLEDAIIEDEWGRTHASGVHVGGRVVLNIWRLMRGEVKLNMYSIEAVAEAVLRRKVPSIHCKVLTKWFRSGPGRARFRSIEYVIDRAKLNLEIMNQLDMINRTSELARIFGIDFFSVLSRGSQYRVESMFLRLAHMQNYLTISPGSQQVASQPAMECLPLVMEPESGFYADPVVVLDFQSLYPSMIIAYNLCFCTCLGKVLPSKANTLGVSSFSPDPHVLSELKNNILLTPNGVMYAPSKVRRGILPRLLEEILSTRIMVKRAMKKLPPSQKVLYRIFNARQLALKLISNVTYGYTAAGFSGRMPCAELADSIVQCGRRTLEKAISFVNSHDKWKARVVYGDTDSMFVLLKGRTVKEAFKIGHEIASAVTAMNPNPIVLKMEKVYHPCFLLTKKRYVGYSYETPDQIKPMFDAKGIETVRRDTCGAVAKTMEQSLRLFFEHQDIFKVKDYLQRQWTRIISNRVPLQDFVFAKEVRLGTYSTRESASLPPAAIVATKAMRSDPRAEPRYAERVPYVVIHGEPGARLVDMVVDPLELLAIDSPFRLNDLYYINKQIIPALQRVFGLVGADLNMWFSDMPRLVRGAFTKHRPYAPNLHRTRIDYYYLSKHCIMCGELVQASIHLCEKCSTNRSAVATAMVGRTSKLERDIKHLAAICGHCGGGDWIVESGVKCTSLACSVFYERRKVQKELQALTSIASHTGFYPNCMVEWF